MSGRQRYVLMEVVMLLVLYVGVYLLVWMQHVIMGVWNSVQKV